MVRRVRYEPAVRVAAGFGVSLRTARKWASRYNTGGAASLSDRSSRPRRCSGKLSEEDISGIIALRKEHLTGDEIALRLGLCRSSVFRALRKFGLPGTRNKAQAHPALQTTDQWQGGTSYQNGIERAGIRPNVHPLMEKNGLPACVDATLQFPTSSQRSWQKISSLTIAWKVNNVLTLYI